MEYIYNKEEHRIAQEAIVDCDKYTKTLKMLNSENVNNSCSNCLLLSQGTGCEIYPSAWNWISVLEDEFSCSRWERV